MDLAGEMLYGSLRKMVIPGFLWGSIHRRGAELAEIGEFLKSRTLTPRPSRLRSAISSSALQESLEADKKGWRM